jgi:hypothetical protein
MTVTMQHAGLKRLNQYLQNQLPPQAQVTPMQVQCAVKDTLMVLVQHPPGNAPNPSEVFGSLEQAIAALPNDLIAALPANLNGTQIKLFLRVLGQQKPYAFHHVAFPKVNPFEMADAIAMGEDLLTEIQAPAPMPSMEPDLSPALEPPPSNDEPGGDLVYAANATEDTHYLSDELVEPEPVALKPWRSLTKPLLIGAGGLAAALVLGLGVYALTRPCVIGTCTSLETAQSLSQQAAQTLQTGKPEAAAQQATQQLQEARQLTADIPAWSGQHEAAQTLQKQLDQVLTAEATARNASQKGQVAAQPISEWQAAKSQWETAIAQLAAVPPESPLHSFAQKRLADYRGNLAFIQQRISAEQDAQNRLAAARQTAELATARQSVAQKPVDWRQAQVTWQVAVNALQQIPNGTTAHAEAQQLLESYRPKLGSSRDRATKEQLAQRVYTQATNYEKQAKAAQQSNQWSQAASSWQNALNAAKQVPNDTSVSEAAQTLVSSYTGSLQQAQAVVKIRGDLDRVCLGSGKICDYTIKNDAIEVQFVPAYERKVRTLGGMSQFSGDYNTLNQVNTHLASLLNALQAVSNNAGLPIQVYNSDNQLLGSVIPGRS